jgi:hypothetical protein
MIKEIWTCRNIPHQFFRQIIWEWENEVANELGIAISDKSKWEKRANDTFGIVARKLDPKGKLVSDVGCPTLFKRQPCAIAFCIYSPLFQNSYLVQENVIPLIIDCWKGDVDVACRSLARSKAVVVTNIELVHEFERRGLTGRVIYVPLAVEQAVTTLNHKKEFDIIQIGRRNAVLHKWALQLVFELPTLEYVYTEYLTSHAPTFFSTKSGELSIKEGRAHYLAAHGAAKVSLVSSPGIDGGEVRTGGLNPVTPRFYEAAALGCRLVGRYPLNGADFIENRVNTVCPNVDSYDEFKNAVLIGLNTTESAGVLTREFIETHTAGAMARRIRTELGRIGISIAKA